MSILKRFYKPPRAASSRSLAFSPARRGISRATVVPRQAAPLGIARSYGVLCRHMDKQTISFRLESDKVAALDALASVMERDRTYLLGEAVQAYLETQRWHLREIEAGIAEADAGLVIDHQKVKTMAAKWRRKT